MAKHFMITDTESELTGVISTIDENTVKVEWEDDRSEEYTNKEFEALLETDGYTVEEVVIEDEAVNVAQDSIKTHTDTVAPGVSADGNPKTRLEMMLAVIGGLGQMDMNSLSKYFNDVIVATNKPAEHGGLDAVAGHNQDTIKMKPSAAMAESMLKLEKEEQDTIFGETTLTEEAKTKISTLFETAVTARVLAETTKLQEDMEVAFDKNVKELSEGLVDKVDEYFTYVVKEWMEENKVAIESSLRTRITNEFIDQLKTVFVENYIEIPEDKVDVLEAVVIENEDLKKEINDKVNETIEKDKEILALKKAVAVEKVTEGLTLPQKTKLRTLVVETEYVSDEDFTKKVEVIKESFLKTPVKESNILTEGLEPEEKPEQSVVSNDPAIEAAYAKMFGTGKIQ